MDELKMKLSSAFMLGMAANLVTKAINKKFGCDADIQINEIEIVSHDGKIYLHTDVDAKLTTEELQKIIKSNGFG